MADTSKTTERKSKPFGRGWTRLCGDWFYHLGMDIVCQTDGSACAAEYAPPKIKGEIELLRQRANGLYSVEG